MYIVPNENDYNFKVYRLNLKEDLCQEEKIPLWTSNVSYRLTENSHESGLMYHPYGFFFVYIKYLGAFYPDAGSLKANFFNDKDSIIKLLAIKELTVKLGYPISNQPWLRPILEKYFPNFASYKFDHLYGRERVYGIPDDTVQYLHLVARLYGVDIYPFTLQLQVKKFVAEHIPTEE